MKTLDGERIQKFFNQKAEKGRLDGKGGLSTKTLRNIKNTMNACFEQAVYNGLIQTNPLQGVRLPRYEQKEMRILSRDEMYKLIQMANVADTRFSYGVIFTLYTGLRLGELLGLKWSDVDDLYGSKPRIHIRQTLTRKAKPRKNDPDYEIIRWNP